MLQNNWIFGKVKEILPLLKVRMFVKKFKLFYLLVIFLLTSHFDLQGGKDGDLFYLDPEEKLKLVTKLPGYEIPKQGVYRQDLKKVVEALVKEYTDKLKFLKFKKTIPKSNQTISGHEFYTIDTTTAFNCDYNHVDILKIQSTKLGEFCEKDIWDLMSLNPTKGTVTYILGEMYQHEKAIVIPLKKCDENYEPITDKSEPLFYNLKTKRVMKLYQCSNLKLKPHLMNVRKTLTLPEKLRLSLFVLGGIGGCCYGLKWLLGNSSKPKKTEIYLEK